MYLMYVDECGDAGFGEGSSRYFILSGMVVHEAYWTQTMEAYTAMRKDLKEHYGMPIDAELHAGKMVSRVTKEYSSISRVNRLMLFRRVLSFEAELENVRIINVVVDKLGKGYGFNPFSAAWDTLINRFENTMEHGNFPHPESQSSFEEKGLLIVDQTDEARLRQLIRHMRHSNRIPSRINIGETVRHDLKRVIEDPLHKQSEYSPLIQLCDTNSYFLK